MPLSALKPIYDRTSQVLADGKTRPFHYATALAITAVAALLRWAMGPAVGGGHAFLLFFPAVMLAGWLGGFGPGIVTTGLSGLLAWFFFLPPVGPLRGVTMAEGISLGIFLVSGCCFSVMMDMLHHVLAQQRELHRELYRQHEWFRVTLTSIGDAVIVTDRNGAINFMNVEAERLTGWSAEEAMEKPIRSVFRIVNEESRSVMDDPVEKVFRERRVTGLANHTVLLAKNGTEWLIQDSASPIYDKEREMVGVVLVFHDATEARRGQRALQTHAEDLETKVFERTLSLQRTITDLEAFSYAVSHDLRSPLRAMLGYATALSEDFSDGMPEVARDYLQRIARAAERLDRLIQDLLTFSRLTSEEKSIEPIDLDRLTREIIQQYPDLQNEQAEIKIGGKLPMVLGHESVLTQVISNLLNNAVKFIPDGVRPEVRIRAETMDHVVRVWFVDNGIGISPENQGRIFKMFEMVNAPGRYSGTGVGLALVKKAVEKMQGTVGVESAAGDGSHFWVELLRAKRP